MGGEGGTQSSGEPWKDVLDAIVLRRGHHLDALAERVPNGVLRLCSTLVMIFGTRKQGTSTSRFRRAGDPAIRRLHQLLDRQPRIWLFESGDGALELVLDGGFPLELRLRGVRHGGEVHFPLAVPLGVLQAGSGGRDGREGQVAQLALDSWQSRVGG